MSAAQFTPAPWKALPCVKREGHTIYSEGGIVVANTGTHSAGSDELANARLIASAPNLYAKVEIAAIIFEEYARLHLAKGTSDGNAKAKRNMEYALEMRAALASCDTHPKGGDVEQAPSLMGSAVPKADAQ